MATKNASRFRLFHSLHSLNVLLYLDRINVLTVSQSPLIARVVIKQPSVFRYFIDASDNNICFFIQYTPCSMCWYWNYHSFIVWWQERISSKVLVRLFYIRYPSETHHQLKSCQILFAHVLRCQVFLTFCAAYVNITVSVHCKISKRLHNWNICYWRTNCLEIWVSDQFQMDILWCTTPCVPRPFIEASLIRNYARSNNFPHYQQKLFTYTTRYICVAIFLVKYKDYYLTIQSIQSTQSYPSFQKGQLLDEYFMYLFIMCVFGCKIYVRLNAWILVESVSIDICTSHETSIASAGGWPHGCFVKSVNLTYAYTSLKDIKCSSTRMKINIT